MTLVYIILGLCFLFLFLYLIPIKMEIHFKLGSNSIAIIKISVFFITFTKRIDQPLSKILALLSREDYNPGEIKEALKNNRWPKNMDRIWKRIKDDIPRFLEIIKAIKIFRFIKLKKLKLYSEVGLSDAYRTGLMIGIFWSMAGIILTKLFTGPMLRGKKIGVNFVPIFSGKSFLIEYDCIITSHLGHIILIFYKILHSLRFSKNYEGRFIYE